MFIEHTPYINSVKYLFEIHENGNLELEFRCKSNYCHANKFDMFNY